MPYEAAIDEPDKYVKKERVGFERRKDALASVLIRAREGEGPHSPTVELPACHQCLLLDIGIRSLYCAEMKVDRSVYFPHDVPQLD